AVRDFSKYALTEDAGGRNSLQDQLAQFNRHARRADDWLENGRSLAGRLDLPSLPRVKAPRMHVPTPNVPSFNPPAGMNVPDVGSADSWSAFLWAGVVAAVGLVLWKLWAQWQTTVKEDTGWKLGPWPVNPARMTTAQE